MPDNDVRRLTRDEWLEIDRDLVRISELNLNGSAHAAVLDEAREGPATLREIRSEFSLEEEMHELARVFRDAGIDPSTVRPYAVRAEEVRDYLGSIPEIRALPARGDEVLVGGVRCVVV